MPARGQSQGEGGDSPVRQHALPAYVMPGKEGGNSPCQADEQADKQADEQADKGEGDGTRTPLARGPSPEEGGDPP